MTRVSLSLWGGVLALLILFMITGCATKRYGRMQPVSSIEEAKYDCDQLAIEVSKVESFMKQVEDGAKIDGRSVLGFLGDFGIGNAMEKGEAMRSARDRLEELRSLQVEKGCI